MLHVLPNFHVITKFMPIKHNDSEKSAFEVFGLKKNPNLPTHFFQTCYSKHIFFFFWPNTVASHFVPRSFRTQVFSYLLWSFRTYFLVISYPVTTISYPGHFVPILVISYLGQLGTKWLYGGQFVPKSFRTLFGHFVPILVISYPEKMDGWIDERTDRQACFDWNDKLTSYS